MQRKHKVPPLIWTVICVVAIAIAASSSIGKTADLLLIVLRLLMLLVGSVLVVWVWWKHRQSGDVRKASPSWDRRVRDWFLDRPSDDPERDRTDARN